MLILLFLEVFPTLQIFRESIHTGKCTTCLLAKSFVKATKLRVNFTKYFFEVGTTDFKTPSTKKQFTKEIASQYEN